MTRLTRLKRTGAQILAEVSEKNVPFMAAGIAYNAFVSLAPLLILLLLLASTTGAGLEDRLVAASRPGCVGGAKSVGDYRWRGRSILLARSRMWVGVMTDSLR
jgi:membrane protein